MDLAGIDRRDPAGQGAFVVLDFESEHNDEGEDEGTALLARLRG